MKESRMFGMKIGDHYMQINGDWYKLDCNFDVERSYHSARIFDKNVKQYEADKFSDSSVLNLEKERNYGSVDSALKRTILFDNPLEDYSDHNNDGCSSIGSEDSEQQANQKGFWISFFSKIPVICNNIGDWFSEKFEGIKDVFRNCKNAVKESLSSCNCCRGGNDDLNELV